jgi:hypothetical protein
MGDGGESLLSDNGNGPLLNLLVAALGSLICFGPLFGFNRDAEAALQHSVLAVSIQSQPVVASLVGVIVCTIPMISDLALDLYSRERTFAVIQDALARAFISVVVLGVASAHLSISSHEDYDVTGISLQKVLVGFACAKILISSGFLTRLCLFDRRVFPVRSTCAMTVIVGLNAVLRLYAATVGYSESVAFACVASSALVLFGGLVLSVRCIVKFLVKWKSKGWKKLASHDFLSLAFLAPFLTFVTGDIVVTYSHGLYSGLLMDASPVCLSAIMYILAGSMIAMNVIEGRHVRALIIASKVR